jgi:hypothetical protein
MISRIDSRHWKISTGRHFQNGHHNTAKIQHCPISSKFDMWVDNDQGSPNHIIYPHIKFWWYWTMLNCCGIVVAILKMATSRNFSMSGINSGHHYLPTYQILMILDNVEFLTPIFYTVFWQPFWKWQTSSKFWKRRFAPLMVTYQYVKFYVSIIIHLEVININVRNFNFHIGFYGNPHWFPTLKNFYWSPFSKWPPQYRKNSTLSNIIKIWYVGR